MKNLMMVLGIAAVITSVGCDNNAEGEYVDLNTGQKVRVEKSEEKGYMVNAETNKPVYLYVDPAKKDTFYGRTGKRVNNEVVRTSNGMFQYTGDDEYVYKDGDYKLKAEADGDYKVKDGDYKLKSEADGDYKVKDGDDYKKKVDKDGDVKIKDGDTKIKVDDGKVEVKRKD